MKSYLVIIALIVCLGCCVNSQYLFFGGQAIPYCAPNTAFIPHPTDCSKYIKCGQDIEPNVILSCNAPFLYNPRIFGTFNEHFIFMNIT